MSKELEIVNKQLQIKNRELELENERLKENCEMFERVNKKLSNDVNTFRSSLNDALNKNIELVQVLNNLRAITEEFTKFGYVKE